MAVFYSDGIHDRDKDLDMDIEDHGQDEGEQVPFLDQADNNNASNQQEEQEEEEEDSTTDRKATTSAIPTVSSSRKLRTRLMVTLFLIILSVELGAGMISGPLTSILESIACRQYYLEIDPSKVGEDGRVVESMCKTKEVQMELAAVRGYMEFFDGVLSMSNQRSILCQQQQLLTISCPGATLAIPYGLLADRYGRRPAIFLSIPGFTINAVICVGVLWFSEIFPLRFIWLSCLAWFFGGGPAVAFAIIWTMMADVTGESERYFLFPHAIGGYSSAS